MSLLGKMLGFGRNEHYDRGIRLFDQGSYEEAIAEFVQAQASRGGRKDQMTERLASFYTAESYAHLGHTAMKHGLWERADECFRHALEVHPHYADLHFHLALALRALKRMEPALQEIGEALAINPRFAKAHFYQGLLHYEMGAREAGLESLCTALELEPGFRTETFARGMSYHNSDDFLAALQAFEQVSYTDVDDILFHFRLGDDMYRRGMYSEAITEYQKALTLNPNYADIRNHLGIAYSASGLFAEAVAEFEAALSVNPRFVDALLNLAITLRDNGRTDAARARFREVLVIEPDNAIALSNIGEDRSDGDTLPRAA